MDANYNHSPISLIAWDKIYRPKCEGDLGIRKTKDVNATVLENLAGKS